MNIPPIFKFRKYILFAAALITILQGYQASKLSFDYDIAQLFPKNDPELIFHQSVAETFAYHQPYLILGIETPEGVFNDRFLQSLDQLTHRLEAHPLIRSVEGPTSIRNMLLTPFGRVDPPFIHLGDSRRYERDSIRLHAYADVASKFISRRHSAVCLYLQLTEDLNDRTKDELRDFIEVQLDRREFDRHYLYGDVYVKDTYLEELQSEMYLLSGLSLALIIGILFLTFRSVWGVVLPMIIVILSVVWTLGTMRLSGVSINLMTVLIPTLVAIISLSDVIHVMTRFREQREEHDSRRSVIAAAVRDIRLALLLTSATTALGFLTLTYSSVQPFVEFGLFTAVGVVYAFLLAIFLLPTLLDWFPVRATGVRTSRFSVLLQGAYRLIQRQRGAILVAAAIILALSLAGSSRARIDAYLYEELSASDDFSQTLRFFEEHFTGIRNFELYLKTGDSAKTLLDSGALKEIDRLERYLSEVYELRESYSIVTAVKRLHRAKRDGDPAQFVIPGHKREIEDLGRLLDQYYDALGLIPILTRDYREGRVLGKLQDVGSAEIRRRNRRLRQFIETEIDPALLGVRLTGSSLLLDRSNEVITWHLLYGLLFAIFVVSLIIGGLFRSPRVMAMALLPNLLPLLMILGIIGWAGLGLKMSTAIIFTISFGIAVDDTLHFMTRLRHERKKGRTIDEAIRITYRSTGRAIVLTSVILILGFGILLFSSFPTTFMTGLLISLALLFALFADLALLPALLSAFWPDEVSG